MYTGALFPRVIKTKDNTTERWRRELAGRRKVTKSSTRLGGTLHLSKKVK